MVDADFARSVMVADVVVVGLWQGDVYDAKNQRWRFPGRASSPEFPPLGNHNPAPFAVSPALRPAVATEWRERADEVLLYTDIMNEHHETVKPRRECPTATGHFAYRGVELSKAIQSDD